MKTTSKELKTAIHLYSYGNYKEDSYCDIINCFSKAKWYISNKNVSLCVYHKSHIGEICAYDIED